MTTINVTTGGNTFTVTTGSNLTIAVTLTSSAAINYVSAGTKFIFDGAGGDTYIIYNSTTSQLEFWVDGTKKFQV